MKKKTKVDLFLDSGAFSAWSQGVEIPIHEYIDFIKKNKRYINVYANLDAIGSAQKTLQNQKIMEKSGLTPLPCFHYGEDIKYLKMYLKKYNYVALGGMVPISNKDLIPWLDKIFSEFICDDNGIPKVKIHGFGMTSLKLMFRYPWYSVDSTSWVTTGRMGGLLIPRAKNGIYIYDENAWKITVSAKSPNKNTKGHHIDNIPKNQRAFFLRYFKDKGYVLGKSEFHKENPKTYELKESEKWNKKREEIVETIIEPGLCNDYKLRDELNIIYFKDLENNMPKYPQPLKIKKKNGFC